MGEKETAGMFNFDQVCALGGEPERAQLAKIEAELLELKAEYDALSPAFEMKRQMIALRKKAGLTQEEMAERGRLAVPCLEGAAEQAKEPPPLVDLAMQQRPLPIAEMVVQILLEQGMGKAVARQPLAANAPETPSRLGTLARWRFSLTRPVTCSRCGRNSRRSSSMSEGAVSCLRLIALH